MAGIPSNSPTRIKTCSVAGVATQVFSGPGTLERIVNNTSTQWTIGIVDGTAGATITTALIAKGSSSGNYDFNCKIANGLRIITTGAATINPDATVVWRQ